MGWRDNQYYYRSSRVNGQVKTSYVGTGHTALLMSQLDEHEREQAKLRRRAWKEIQRRESAIDAQIDELGDHIKALVDAHLIISGMHQHKREWRRKRDPIE
mgnify:CR=1 FL=1